MLEYPMCLVMDMVKMGYSGRKSIESEKKSSTELILFDNKNVRIPNVF